MVALVIKIFHPCRKKCWHDICAITKKCLCHFYLPPVQCAAHCKWLRLSPEYGHHTLEPPCHLSLNVSWTIQQQPPPPTANRFDNTSDSIEWKRLVPVGDSKGALGNKENRGRADRLPWGPAHRRSGPLPPEQIGEGAALRVCGLAQVRRRWKLSLRQLWVD